MNEEVCFDLDKRNEMMILTSASGNLLLIYELTILLKLKAVTNTAIYRITKTYKNFFDCSTLVAN